MVGEVLSSGTSENSSDVNEILESWRRLPDYFVYILKKAFLFLVYVTFFVGSFLLAWGLLEWLSGWNELNGKRNVIRGIVLIIVALAPSLV